MFKIANLADEVTTSPIYYPLLQNQVQIDFFLIKLEIDQAIAGMTYYDEVKEHFLNAMRKQSSIIQEKLDMILKIFETNIL